MIRMSTHLQWLTIDRSMVKLVCDKCSKHCNKQTEITKEAGRGSFTSLLRN